jgi:hypothetical protein
MVKLITLVMLLHIVCLFPQNYLLKSYVIDDGGIARMTGGNYIMGGSVSQSFIGKVEGGGYTAYIGYWPPWGSLPGIEESDRSSGLKQPIVFNLHQNYPNPVSHGTVIKYSIANPCKVELILYDITGRQVAVLVNENQKLGYYQVNWDIHNVSEKQLPNGVYFYRFTAGEYTNTKKMVIVR